jgi:hypothetical protein
MAMSGGIGHVQMLLKDDRTDTILMGLVAE